MKIVRYQKDFEPMWNDFVARSKNGTFLFNRQFMDYHADRFADCSLLFFEGERLLAVLPANYSGTDEQTVYSHQGLTYGGLILPRDTKAETVLEIFNNTKKWYADTLHARRLIYKPIPYIYSCYPAQEDLYALFRQHATLAARGLSSTIFLPEALKMPESRKSGCRKAKQLGLVMEENGAESEEVSDFWQVLDDVLEQLHAAKPVHSIDEMRLLMRRFPQNIGLYTVKNPQQRVVAGTWLFITQKVVHTQYIAANDEGKKSGALDLLISSLIAKYKSTHTYFDFGISTEQAGRVLNKGLIFQKEGFGGRGVVYDTYEMTL